eukprot:360220_1
MTSDFDNKNNKCQYCFKFNTQNDIQHLVKIASGIQQCKHLNWSRTRYKATFELPKRFIDNIKHDCDAVFADIFKRLVLYNKFKLYSWIIDEKRKYVTIEFGLKKMEYSYESYSLDVNEVEGLIRCTLSQYDDCNEFCEVEMMKEGIIDEDLLEINNMKSSIKYYIIDIKDLMDNEGGYDLCYNHAGANCGVCNKAARPSWEDCEEWYNFKFCHYSGYSHMDHLHIATVDDYVNNTLFMWVSYNGIVAL